MSRNSKKPLDMSVLFNSSTGTLAQIAKKTNSLTKLANIVRQICPDLPANGYQLGNITANTLTIEVANGAWGQRLQFERNRLAQAFNQTTQGLVTHIEIKVMPFLEQRRHQQNKQQQLAATPKPKKHLSKQAGEQLLQAAEYAPESLKKKIARLAQLADKKE